MRAVRLTVVAAVILASLGLPAVAIARSPCTNPLTHKACAEARDGKVGVGRGERSRPRPSQVSSTQSGSARTRPEDTWAVMGAAFCADANSDVAASGGASQAVVLLCRGLIALPIAPSREQVLTAFRELPLYRGVIQTDPRTATLVNLETYFWCGDGGRTCELIGEGERTVTLLGQPVRIRPRILSYRWDFGDGAGQEISAGKAAHTYAHAMTATVTLTLTWTADYAVGTGAFQDIGDTTTTTSPARALPVREAESVIVPGG